MLLVERVVTEQRKLQARLLHQEKMAAFGLLAAGVAHEMGNPLSSIEAQLQLLDPKACPATAAPVVATVRQEVGRLGRILRELVDFARRRRDEATLVSVQSVVGDALRLLRHDRRMREVTLREEFDPETPPVFVVEDHLMQVVLNLLLNALDAMPAGGTLRIEVGRRAARSRCASTTRASAWTARSWRAASSRSSRRRTPAGAPASASASAATSLRATGGDIELHSAPGRGTTAVVTLPALRRAAPRDRVEPRRRPATGVPAARP